MEKIMVGETVINEFLARLGGRTHRPVKLYLLGGAAVILLGSDRETMDLDFTSDIVTVELRDAAEAVGDELHFDVEYVAIEEFIPLPAGAEMRHRFIGQYGSAEVYVFDPYSIALSKLARGHRRDLDDCAFLLRAGHIQLDQLQKLVKASLPAARRYDFEAAEMQANLTAVQTMLNRRGVAPSNTRWLPIILIGLLLMLCLAVILLALPPIR